jgi:hypothetical protein
MRYVTTLKGCTTPDHMKNEVIRKQMAIQATENKKDEDTTKLDKPFG